jgi:hypothetical protein
MPVPTVLNRPRHRAETTSPVPGAIPRRTRGRRRHGREAEAHKALRVSRWRAGDGRLLGRRLGRGLSGVQKSASAAACFVRIRCTLASPPDRIGRCGDVRTSSPVAAWVGGIVACSPSRGLSSSGCRAGWWSGRSGPTGMGGRSGKVDGGPVRSGMPELFVQTSAEMRENCRERLGLHDLFTTRGDTANADRKRPEPPAGFARGFRLAAVAVREGVPQRRASSGRGGGSPATTSSVSRRRR